MATALVKVASVTAPWSGRDTELFKFVACEPNVAGPKGRVSFAKPYLIVESSQYSAVDRAPHYYAHFVEQLTFRGFNDVQFVD